MCKIIKALLIVLILIIFGFLISIPIVNNCFAKNITKHLKEIPLPPNTEYVESAYKAGKLVGNGNGMQYFGCILIKSDMCKDDLQEYYLSYALNDWDCIIEEQNSDVISVLERDDMSFKSKIDCNNYYILYSWGDGDNFYSHLDIRGH